MSCLAPSRLTPDQDNSSIASELVVGAHFEPDYPLDNGLMFERELTLRFTIGDPVRDRERLLGLMATGRLEPAQIITHRLPLEAATEAYRLFDSREATKVVLTP